jgi:hypothetical protein
VVVVTYCRVTAVTCGQISIRIDHELVLSSLAIPQDE